MKKYLLLTSSVIVFLFAGHGQDLPQEQDSTKKSGSESYFQKYRPLAIREMLRSGVPADITLAQGYHESGGGKSSLALNANNHFGIKTGSNWDGPFMLRDDDRKNEPFRKYPSIEESFMDHSDFLRTRPWYAPLFTLHPNDYKGWARGLKKAGYATAPNYSSILISIIEKNNLNEITKKVVKLCKFLAQL